MDLILLDKASGFLRSRFLTSLTWVGLIMSSEDKEQWDPSSSVSVSFDNKLEAGPGLKGTVIIVLEVSPHTAPSLQTCLVEAESWVDEGPSVGPARPIDRDILLTNQQLIKSLMRG